MSSFKRLLPVCLSVFSICFSAYAVDDLDQGWRKTNLNYKVIQYFNDQQYPCYSNVVNLLGCIHFLNGLGASLKPMQTLTTKEILALDPSARYTVLKEFSGLELVQLDSTPPKSVTIAEASMLIKKREALFRDAAQQAFLKPHEMDFDSLTQQMLILLPSDISSQKAIAMALNQMISVHDGHGHIDAIAYLKDQESNGDKSIVGIGATLNGGDENTMVANVIKGSPAERYGLKKGDLIVGVDGRDLKNQRLEQIVSWIRGEKGTTVKLQIQRDGSLLPQPLSIVRDKVVILNVDVETVEDMGAKFSLIRLNNFMDVNACSRIQTAVTHLPNDVKGIILDVRDNPGGLLDQAVCVGGIFVGQKPIVYVRSVRNGKEDSISYPQISETSQKTSLPLVVLTNNMSASASEILAGAIQDYKRGWLVGTRTFGKATVQAPKPLALDPTVVYFQTIARFYEPSGRTSQIVGISPDFEAYSTPNPTDAQQFEPREEDLIPSALPSEGKTWIQTQQMAIDQITGKCLRPNHRAEDIFGARLAAKQDADYQLLKAEEVLYCDQNYVASSASSTGALVR